MVFSLGRQNLILKCQFTNMKKRIALNTFYTLGIVVSVVGIKWAYENANYPIVAFLVASGLFFLYLKIKITKEVRAELKAKEEQYKSFSGQEQPLKEDPNAPLK